MASLKEFRARIASVKSTQKITRAMQMVAAARLRRAQDRALAARPYTREIKKMVASLANSMRGNTLSLLKGTGSDQTHLLVVMTAERGLCGGFNNNIVKLTRQRIKQLQSAGKDVKILTIGKKGSDALKRDFSALMIDHIDLRQHREISSQITAPIGAMLIRRFEAGEFDVATLMRSQFQNVLTQTPVADQLIPVPPSESAPSDGQAAASTIYEPEQDQILTELLPRYINAQILMALLENAAGEQGARMTAMDNATRNASDMIKTLDLRYNRARQAQITRELIEIISGAEAL